MYQRSIGARLLTGSLATGLALALSACGGVATVAPTAAPTSAPPAATVAPTTAPTVAPTAAPTTAAIESQAQPTPQQPTAATTAGSDTSGPDVSAVDPCALLDKTMVATLYGPIAGAPQAAAAANHPGQSCTFEAEKVTLTISVYGGDTKASALLDELEQRGLPMEADSGMSSMSFAGQTSDEAALLLTKDGAVVLLELTNKSDVMIRAATLLYGMGETAMQRLADQAQAEVAASGTAADEQASAAEGPCALLSAAEVERVLGPLDGAPDNSMQNEDGGDACAYAARDGLLFVSSMPGGADLFAAQVEKARGRGAPLAAVAGLGDEAYVAAASMDGAPNGDAVQGMLLARKGDTVMQIGVLSGLDAADTQAALEELARLAAARLP